jgi:hypothetical protein
MQTRAEREFEPADLAFIRDSVMADDKRRAEEEAERLRREAAEKEEQERRVRDAERIAEEQKKAAVAQKRFTRAAVVGLVIALGLAGAAIRQLLATQAEQQRFATVFDLIAYHADDFGAPRSAFVLSDRSNVENLKGLAIETIKTARNIALRDLRNARVLWVDDHPENNRQIEDDIRDRLHRIGTDFELSTDVRDALKRVQSRSFHVVITNYGKGRCGQDDKAIAECVLEGVKKLPFRSPVVVFSEGVTAETSDTMKCKGAMAETDTPDVLFAWIVRALDAGPNFRPSREIQRFCADQEKRS